MHDGETFEHAGRSYRANVEDDDTMGVPWEEHDGHGRVSPQLYHPFGTGRKPPKKAGELLLCWDDGYYRLYDFAEACRTARRDGWGCREDKPGETKRQTAARAAREDFERMRDWCQDRWRWIGVVVTLMEGRKRTKYTASLWGIESDAGGYLDEVARELADQIGGELLDLATVEALGEPVV